MNQNVLYFCSSLHLKEEAYDFVETDTLKNLVKKYSQFINFPIYLWNSKVLVKTHNSSFNLLSLSSFLVIEGKLPNLFVCRNSSSVQPALLFQAYITYLTIPSFLSDVFGFNPSVNYPAF
jgi:hypothetical protein